MKYIFILFIMWMMLFSAYGYTQVVDTTETTTSSVTSDEDFVDLSDQATLIKVEPEKPRVTLITDRIKPEFTDVNLNKSFMQELLTKSNKDLLRNKVTPSQNSTIDIEKIITKSR